MKAFVIGGGAGFIGSHLIDLLIEKVSVTVFDNLSSGRREFVYEENTRKGDDMKEYYECNKIISRKINKVIKIFIAENIPSLNKGEMAILEGMLESFKVLGRVEVAMFSYYPEIDAPRYGTKVKIIDIKKSLLLSGNIEDYNKIYKVFYKVFNPIFFLSQHLLFLILYKALGSKILKFMRSEIWKEYVESDIIIIGHDGTFGIGTPQYFYRYYIPFFAKLLRKPVVIYGGCISRSNRFFKNVVKFVLNEINLITLREDYSYQNLRELGVKNNRVFVIPDLAFLLRPVSPDQAKEIITHECIEETNRPLIGITVTREIASMAFSGLSNPAPASNYYKHIEMLAQVIDNLTTKLNATVIFVPHCIGLAKKLDDRIVARDILRLVKNKNRVKLITNEYGPKELKGLIGQFDLFIGERVHSFINAMSMCVPSIILLNSIDRRRGIIKMVGQENAICYVEGLDANVLISKIDEIWSEREKIKSELKSKIEIIEERAMLNGKLLEELL